MTTKDEWLTPPYILEAVRSADDGVAFLHVTFEDGRLLDVRASEPRP